MWPCDQARPTASNLNFVAGQAIPNLVTAKLSADGRLWLHVADRLLTRAGDGWTEMQPSGAAPGQVIRTLAIDERTLAEATLLARRRVARAPRSPAGSP